MKKNFPWGKLLITLGFVVLTLAWTTAILDTKLIEWGFAEKSKEEDFGAGIIFVTSFICAHVIAIFFLTVGIAIFFIREFSKKSRISIVWATSSLFLLCACVTYAYWFAFGLPSF